MVGKAVVAEKSLQISSEKFTYVFSLDGYREPMMAVRKLRQHTQTNHTSLVITDSLTYDMKTHDV
ncbi:hypothetical protein J6590_002704 [Homalodisca vitripennis]|nr:hypothetical protein J6590_002704 [Homalodisca vitripennis]